MQLHDFQSWLSFRRRSIISNYDSWQLSRRGLYHSLGSHIVYGPILSLSEQSEIFKSIVEAEVNLAWNGTELIQVKNLYKDDNVLLNAYKSLNLQKLLRAPGHSRNAVVTNKVCCCCTWQRIDDTLIVYSRSMDIKSAGKSDCYLASGIAARLLVHNWILVCAQVHVYKDATAVARRT